MRRFGYEEISGIAQVKNISEGFTVATWMFKSMSTKVKKSPSIQSPFFKIYYCGRNGHNYGCYADMQSPENDQSSHQPNCNISTFLLFAPHTQCFKSKIH